MKGNRVMVLNNTSKDMMAVYAMIHVNGSFMTDYHRAGANPVRYRK